MRRPGEPGELSRRIDARRALPVIEQTQDVRQRRLAFRTQQDVGHAGPYHGPGGLEQRPDALDPCGIEAGGDVVAGNKVTTTHVVFGDRGHKQEFLDQLDGLR